MPPQTIKFHLDPPELNAFGPQPRPLDPTQVDAFENEPVEGMEEIIVANPDSLPGASGKAGGAGGKTGEGTSSGADGPDAGPKEGDSDLYKALFTICTELGQKLDTEQKRGLAKALGL